MKLYQYGEKTRTILALAKTEQGVTSENESGANFAYFHKLVGRGLLFTFKGCISRVKKHYFDTQERADAYYAANPPKGRNPKKRSKTKPKPKAKPITLLQPKPVNKEKAARLAWAAQEAIKPAGLKFTKCPGFTGESRFAPAPDSHGAGFTAEWKQLRSVA